MFLNLVPQFHFVLQVLPRAFFFQIQILPVIRNETEVLNLKIRKTQVLSGYLTLKKNMRNTCFEEYMVVLETGLE
jgi:hypothetical protein